jgi:hypothetical protein
MSARIDPEQRLNRLLLGRYRIVPYAELPEPYQLALAYWMCIDGEAWDPKFDAATTEAICPAYEHARSGSAAVKDALRKSLPGLVRRYGRKLFGVAEIPPSALLETLACDANFLEEGGTLTGFGGEPVAADAHPATNRWPVILSATGPELMEDGWHRLGCYVHRGDETLPVVFFPTPKQIARTRRDRGHKTAKASTA